MPLLFKIEAIKPSDLEDIIWGKENSRSPNFTRSIPAQCGKKCRKRKKAKKSSILSITLHGLYL